MQTHRLLILEGDEHVLRALARAMRPAYEVVALAKAEEAVERVEHGERWDAALVDVGVPEMGGVAFARKVMTLCPGLQGRILLLTAGAPPHRFEVELSGSTLPVMSKPFVRGELLAALMRLAG